MGCPPGRACLCTALMGEADRRPKEQLPCEMLKYMTEQLAWDAKEEGSEKPCKENAYFRTLVSQKTQHRPWVTDMIMLIVDLAHHKGKGVDPAAVKGCADDDACERT